VVRTAALIGLATAAAVVSAASARTGDVRVLVRTSKPIAAFAQNGDLIAWGQEKGAGCRAAVHVRTLSTGRERVVAAPRCFSYPFYDEAAFGVAPGRLLWLAGEVQGHSADDTFLIAALGAATKARVVKDVYQTWGGGDYVPRVAGDGQTLAYAFLSSDCNVNEGNCDNYDIGGAAYLYTATGPKAVPSSGPALDMAVSGNRIALLPARHHGVAEDQWAVPPKYGPLGIRDLASGRLVAAVPPRGGTFISVALSETTAAVLVKRQGQLWVERYNAATGVRVDATAVPAKARSLALAGARAVFRVANAVETIAPGSTKVTQLAAMKGDAVGLSVSGSRIAWAESSRGGGRVVALKLP
jgi:hypothetical protein